MVGRYSEPARPGHKNSYQRHAIELIAGTVLAKRCDASSISGNSLVGPDHLWQCLCLFNGQAVKLINTRIDQSESNCNELLARHIRAV
jgi:hypothetical protein